MPAGSKWWATEKRCAARRQRMQCACAVVWWWQTPACAMSDPGAKRQRPVLCSTRVARMRVQYPCNACFEERAVRGSQRSAREGRDGRVLNAWLAQGGAVSGGRGRPRGIVAKKAEMAQGAAGTKAGRRRQAQWRRRACRRRRCSTAYEVRRAGRWRRVRAAAVGALWQAVNL